METPWLANLKTIIQGLGFLDPSLLPASFAGDVLDPVVQNSHQLDELTINSEALELISGLAGISAGAEEKTWYFWEKVGTAFCSFVRAGSCTFYRQGTSGALNKIHPLETEEDAEEQSWPRDVEAHRFDVEGDGGTRTSMIRLGTNTPNPLALEFAATRGIPFREHHLNRLLALSDLIFNLLSPHFPTLQTASVMEVIGADTESEETGTRLLGRDPGFLKAVASVEQAAGSEATVYLKGESGTGKELFARHLHQLGERGKGPFIPINCSAIPHELIESEMFGHEKGAFTGAYYRKIGKVEQAHGGTLFLDEIGEMPLPFQAKLLRYLQEKKFSRVGGNNAHFSDARIVVATHRDLKEMVREGTFREDLYYRIHVIPISIPPLRRRGRDIRYLSELFFARFIAKSRASRRQVDEAVYDALEHYHFPGNVRELENIIQRTVVMTQKPVIAVEDLPEEVFKTEEDPAERYRLHPFEKFDRYIPHDRETLKRLKKDVDRVAFSYLRDLDRRFLLHLLEANGGSARKAAEAASINRTLFYKLLKRAGLDISILNRSDS